MPFNKEAFKEKLKKKNELKELVRKGEITLSQSAEQSRAFDRSRDKYGLCDPGTEDTIDLDDID